MAVVYRYFNNDTKEYDYIGIVYSENRTLDQRVYEHSKEERFQGDYKIQYFEVPTQSDAEVWEGHLISKYKTYERLNDKKAKWGLCSYLPNDEDLWLDYIPKEIKTRNVDKGTKRYRHARDYKWNLKTIFNYNVICFDKEILEAHNFKHNNYIDKDGVYTHKLGIAMLQKPVFTTTAHEDDELCKTMVEEHGWTTEQYLDFFTEPIIDPERFYIDFVIDINKKCGYPIIEYYPHDYESMHENDGTIFFDNLPYGRYSVTVLEGGDWIEPSNDGYFHLSNGEIIKADGANCGLFDGKTSISEHWDGCIDILDPRNSWRLSPQLDLRSNEDFVVTDIKLHKTLKDPVWQKAINDIIANMGDLEKNGIIKWMEDNNEI